jgi:uncharacterized membrane protein
MRVKEREDA